MPSNKTKRRRINVRSIEERMSNKLMEIHCYSPSDAWKEIKLMEMQRELKAIN